MLRRTPQQRAFRMQYMKGYYPEDHYNDYRTRRLFHPRQLKRWYSLMEIRRSKEWLERVKFWSSDNHNNGLKHDGSGAFERELERKGIQVEKYPLASVASTSRLREMVLLRRMELEKRADALLETQREAKKLDQPSSTWFDESDGPLNPHFLRCYAQRSYRLPIDELPAHPVVKGGIDNASPSSQRQHRIAAEIKQSQGGEEAGGEEREVGQEK